MASERESLQVEVERLQEVLHSDDDTSRSSVGGDLPLYIADHDEQSDHIDDGAPSETEESKPSERTRFDIACSLNIINDLETEGDNLTTCLTFNVVYQKIIEEMLRTIEEMRAENKARRDFIEGKIAPKVTRKKRQQSETTFRPGFRTPYFHIPSVGYPPNNSDVALKAGRNEIDPVATDPILWSVKERKTLISAVRDDAMKKTLQPCLNKIDVELEKLNNTVATSEKKEIRERITAINRDIEAIKLYSNEKLLTNVDSTKVDWLRISSNDLKGTHLPTSCQLMWNNVLRPQINRYPWTKAQKQRLKDLVCLEKVQDWTEISRRLQCNRTPFQCLQYYEQHMRKDVSTPWTPAEDKMLEDVVNICRIGNRIPWNQVSFYLEGRGPQQCVYRYMLICPGTKHGRWTPEEDQALIEAVKKVGTISWMDVASHVPNRLASQCRERYTNKLDPSLVIGNWTEDEEIKLITLVKQHGVAWARIAQDMPGRTDARCKTHYELIRREFKGRRIRSEKLRSIIEAYLPVLPKKSVKNTKKDLVRKSQKVSTEEESEEEEEEEPAEEEDESEIQFLQSEQFDRRNPDVKQKYDKLMGMSDKLRSLIRERHEDMERAGRHNDYFVSNLVPTTDKDRDILLELRRLYPGKSLRKVIELARVLCGERLSSRRRSRHLSRQRGGVANNLDDRIRHLLRGHRDETGDAVKKSQLAVNSDVTDASLEAMSFILNVLKVEVDDKRYKELLKKKTTSRMPRVVLFQDTKPRSLGKAKKNYAFETFPIPTAMIKWMDLVGENPVGSRHDWTSRCQYLPPSLSNVAAYKSLAESKAVFVARHRSFLSASRLSNPGRRKPGRPRKIPLALHRSRAPRRCHDVGENVVGREAGGSNGGESDSGVTGALDEVGNDGVNDGEVRAEVGNDGVNDGEVRAEVGNDGEVRAEAGIDGDITNYDEINKAPGIQNKHRIFENTMDISQDAGNSQNISLMTMDISQHTENSKDISQKTMEISQHTENNKDISQGAENTKDISQKTMEISQHTENNKDISQGAEYTKDISQKTMEISQHTENSKDISQGAEITKDISQKTMEISQHTENSKDISQDAESISRDGDDNPLLEEAINRNINVDTTDLERDDGNVAEAEESDEECVVPRTDPESDDLPDVAAPPGGENAELLRYKALLKCRAFTRLKERFASLFLWPQMLYQVRLPRHHFKPKADDDLETKSDNSAVMSFPSSTIPAFSTYSKSTAAKAKETVKDPDGVLKSDHVRVYTAQNKSRTLNQSREAVTDRVKEKKMQENNPSDKVDNREQRKNGSHHKKQHSADINILQTSHRLTEVSGAPKNNCDKLDDVQIHPSSKVRNEDRNLPLNFQERYSPRNYTRDFVERAKPDLVHRDMNLFGEYDFDQDGDEKSRDDEDEVAEAPKSIDLEPAVIGGLRPSSPIPCIEYGGRTSQGQFSGSKRSAGTEELSRCANLRDDGTSLCRDAMTAVDPPPGCHRAKNNQPVSVQYVVVTPKTDIVLNTQRPVGKGRVSKVKRNDVDHQNKRIDVRRAVRVSAAADGEAKGGRARVSTTVVLHEKDGISRGNKSHRLNELLDQNITHQTTLTYNVLNSPPPDMPMGARGRNMTVSEQDECLVGRVDQGINGKVTKTQRKRRRDESDISEVGSFNATKTGARKGRKKATSAPGNDVTDAVTSCKPNAADVGERNETDSVAVTSSNDTKSGCKRRRKKTEKGIGGKRRKTRLLSEQNASPLLEDHAP